VISCDSVKQWPDDPKKSRNAFYALKLITTWYNSQVLVRKDMLEALNNLQMKMATLVSDFTDSGKLHGELQNQEARTKKIMHIVLTIALTLAAATAFIDPLAGVAIAGGIEAISTSLKTAVDVGKASANTLAGGYAGAASLHLDSNEWSA